MSAYLFVHFKEKRSPEGEQVYFVVSKDGFNWETVNDGNPVLWSYEGDRGVRDFTIIRRNDGKFVILATDLSLAYGMPYWYQNNWENISRHGSKCLVMWESDDLIHWSDQKMLKLGDENFGCLWAPDIIYDKEQDDYLIHWSSAHSCNDFGQKAIYYTRTRDFEHFSAPQELYRRADGGSVIDSAMYEENGNFYLFLKDESEPRYLVLMKGASVTGPFEKIAEFDRCMRTLEPGKYEAPTAFKTADNRWCLMIDHYGCPEEEQGYIPFLSEDLDSGHFERSDAAFSFPYGLKHGTVLQITDEEYERLKQYRKSPSER